jgi:hypothetical protein
MTGLFKRFHPGALLGCAGIVPAVLVATASASQATTYYDYRFTLRYIEAYYRDVLVFRDGWDDETSISLRSLAKSDDIWGFLDPFGFTPGQEWNVRVKAAVNDDETATVECTNSPIECGGDYGFTELGSPTAYFSGNRFGLCVDWEFCDSALVGTVAVGEIFTYFCIDNLCDLDRIYGDLYLFARDYELSFEVVRVVPLPPSALLLLGATAGLGMAARRSSRKSATRLMT